jgi:hypothetical protein
MQDRMDEAKRLISNFRTMGKKELLPLIHSNVPLIQLLALLALAKKGFTPTGLLVGPGPAVNALPKNYISNFNKCLGR